MFEAMGGFPALLKLIRVANIHYSSTLEVEAGGLDDQGHPHQFQASLGCGFYIQKYKSIKKEIVLYAQSLSSKILQI